MAEQTDKIHWHPGFYGAAELELLENQSELEFIREYHLGKEPLRVDLLVIKKRPGAVIRNEIGHIFRQHNIVEYKSPDDGLSIDDYYKVTGYACIYKSLGDTVDAIAASEVTVSFFREAYPRELVRRLLEMGLIVEQKHPGIYYVKGNVLFATQLVVISELASHSHSGLRILSKNAGKEDIRTFLKEARQLKKQGDRQNADAVLQVSVLANQKMYEEIRRELGMCDALRELMKDEIEAEIARAVEASKKEIEASKKEAEVSKKEAEEAKKQAENASRETLQSDIGNLMRNTGWTREKAMRMLGVSFAD